MSENKSLNTFENMIPSDASEENLSPIAKELKNRIIDAIIDFQDEVGDIPVDDILKATQNLNKGLLLLASKHIPADKRDIAISDIEELNSVFHDAVIAKYGEMSIDWFVMCYVCTEMQRGILGLE